MQSIASAMTARLMCTILWASCLLPFAGASAQDAAPCSAMAAAERTEACAIEIGLASESLVNEVGQDVVDDLRLIAASNPDFANAEIVFAESHQFWQQYRIKDCDLRTKHLGAGQQHRIAFTECFQRHADARVASLRDHRTDLEPVVAVAREMAPPAPKRVCSLVGMPASPDTDLDACELRAVAARCTVNDQCLVNCLVAGGGEGIGGGCHHLCSGRGSEEHWIRPENSKCSD